jgi:hypothetical protein
MALRQLLPLPTRLVAKALVTTTDPVVTITDLVAVRLQRRPTPPA